MSNSIGTKPTFDTGQEDIWATAVKKKNSSITDSELKSFKAYVLTKKSEWSSSFSETIANGKIEEYYKDWKNKAETTKKYMYMLALASALALGGGAYWYYTHKKGSR